MTSELKPCPSLLRQLLRYDAETGKLFWKERDASMFKEGSRSAAHSCNIWNAKNAGKEAFAADNGRGYLCGTVLDVKFQAHRVIWAIVNGYWPIHEIDHINGNPSDNRIANLRDVPPLLNNKNRARQSNNSSGHVGVRWDAREKRWHSRVKIGGKTTHLGYFDDIQSAVAARKRAETGEGFTERHGT